MDKNLRLEMGNHVFRKLQDAMEHPCRTKDWFGMAEQAINTIYALGERPDELCNSLIKNLTKRAFRPRDQREDSAGLPNDTDAMEQDPPLDAQEVPENLISQGPSGGIKDPGDAFELSQLLFVVGHVAIKHIAYLELVEREMKRQKGDKETGALYIRLIER
jgi:condensin complex subunit 1